MIILAYLAVSPPSKERVRRMNPPRLWSRACAKCGTTIETSYAPERPEIVYCRECYRREVI